MSNSAVIELSYDLPEDKASVHGETPSMEVNKHTAGTDY